jgi:hypothetical protein
MYRDRESYRIAGVHLPCPLRHTMTNRIRNIVKAASRLLKIDLQRAQRWAEVILQGEKIRQTRSEFHRANSSIISLETSLYTNMLPTWTFTAVCGT